MVVVLLLVSSKSSWLLPSLTLTLTLTLTRHRLPLGLAVARVHHPARHRPLLPVGQGTFRHSKYGRTTVVEP